MEVKIDTTLLAAQAAVAVAISHIALLELLGHQAKVTQVVAQPNPIKVAAVEVKVLLVEMVLLLAVLAVRVVQTFPLGRLQHHLDQVDVMLAVAVAAHGLTWDQWAVLAVRAVAAMGAQLITLEDMEP